MTRLPFVVRVAAGAVALAAEKGQEIATGAVSAPLTIGSKSAQAYIKVQQDLADLALRGDGALEFLFPTRHPEQAQWATFDEDEEVDVDLPDTAVDPAVDSDASEPPGAEPALDPSLGALRRAAGRATAAASEETGNSGQSGANNEARPGSAAGRYALYSAAPQTTSSVGDGTAAGATDSTAHAEQPALPEAVSRIDYPELTLAQLRVRLTKLSRDDLTEIVAFERDNRARTPFLDLLESRLGR